MLVLGIYALVTLFLIVAGFVAGYAFGEQKFLHRVWSLETKFDEYARMAEDAFVLQADADKYRQLVSARRWQMQPPPFGDGAAFLEALEQLDRDARTDKLSLD